MDKVQKDASRFLMRIQKKKNKDPFSGEILKEQTGRKNVLDLNILVMVDVSGSISVAQFKQFMSQIDAIKGLSRVKVMEVDTQVVAFYDYFKTGKPSVFRLGGGGGTEFSTAFVKAKKINPDAILFMTDGFVFNNVNSPGIPVGWVITSDGKKPYNFGEVVVKLN
jgi:predicted metal-dependent peptidase